MIHNGYNFLIMKPVTIHLSGAAAGLAGVRQFPLSLADAGTYLDVIAGMAQAYPLLVGLVISADGKALLSSNFLVVNGKDFILPGMWEQQPADGDALTLISPITGGCE